MKKAIIILGLMLSFESYSFAQFKNNIWCFGDSAGILFNANGSKSLFKSAVVGFMSYSSISSNNDSLLFYATTGYKPYFLSPTGLHLGTIFDKTHQPLLNGDTIIGRSWRQELVIIPKPMDSSTFFLIQSPCTIDGVYFSEINMSLNNGLGTVVQKNVQLYDKRVDDWTSAIKSGNGGNWWVISKKSTGWPSDTFVVFSITPQGISGPFYQAAGTSYYGSAIATVFNSTGDKFILLGATGLIEEFYFDRCTGAISLYRTIKASIQSFNPPLYNSGAYSPNNRFFYFTSTSSNDSIGDATIIYQIDLWAANPWTTRDTIWYFNLFHGSWGFIRLAPDNKIYVAINGNPNFGFPFPYSDTTYNMYNMYLGVIKKPNKKGAACDFQPFSFYLGGARTYGGLPYNPDYAMGPLVGSPCDTITGISNIEQEILNAQLKATYISQWQKLFVNAKNIQGRNCELKIFDVNGREVFSSIKQTVPPYFTQDIDVSNLSIGMYLVSLITEKEALSAKFVKG